jgi:hypothetical protein
MEMTNCNIDVGDLLLLASECHIPNLIVDPALLAQHMLQGRYASSQLFSSAIKTSRYSHCAFLLHVAMYWENGRFTGPVADLIDSRATSTPMSRTVTQQAMRNEEAHHLLGVHRHVRQQVLACR